MAWSVTIPRSAQSAAAAVLATHVVGCCAASLVGVFRREPFTEYPSPGRLVLAALQGWGVGVLGALTFPLSLPWMFTLGLPSFWSGKAPRL